MNPLRVLPIAICLTLSQYLLPASAAAQRSNSRTTVINGANADPAAFPFFCSLTSPDGSGSPVFLEPHCGASLIAPQWVLTAAHCIMDPTSGTDKLLDSLDVIVAPYALGHANAGSVRRHSDYMVKHRVFSLMSADLSYDIALIHLSSPVPDIIPIRLPAQGDHSLSQAGTPVKGLGYGLMDSTFFSVPDTLQVVDINVLDYDVCNGPGHYDGELRPGMICAGVLNGPPTGNAAGDSGGPLVASTATGPVQVGIVSWGHGPVSTAEFPGVYTEVASYRNWIDSVISAYEQSTDVKGKTRNPAPTVQVLGKNVSIRFNQARHAVARCAVYDMTGRVVAVSQARDGAVSMELHLPEVASGIYTLRISTGQGGSFAYKLNLQD